MFYSIRVLTFTHNVFKQQQKVARVRPGLKVYARLCQSSNDGGSSDDDSKVAATEPQHENNCTESEVLNNSLVSQL